MHYICPECDAQYDEDLGKCPKDGSRLLPFKGAGEDPMIGLEIAGRFLVKKKLGEGGMGAVYIAHQASVDRLVALKVLKKEFQEDITVVKRFFLEAKAASRLKNPHTITIYDFDKTADGTLYIAMELLSGCDLRAKMDDLGRLTVADTVRILGQVGESLAEAHDHGIVHRDMKPENIFLAQAGGEDEFVKVLDFGIAKAQALTDTKMTRTGIVQGTPAYMAPEAIIGQKVGPEADVYALGIMMYEMLSGMVPFSAETPMQMMMAHLQSNPAPLAEVAPDVVIPRPLHEFLWRCLAKQKEERPADAGVFRDEIRAALAASEGSEAEMMKPLYVTGAGFRGASDTVSALRPGVMTTPGQGGVRTTPGGGGVRVTPGQGGEAMPDAFDLGLGDAGGDQAATLYEAASPAPGGKGIWIGALVGVLLLGAVAAFFLQRGASSGNDAAASPAATTTAASVEPAPAKAPEPAPAEYVALTITSTPNSADVDLGGQRLGRTPLLYKVPKGAGPLTLKLALEGYLDHVSELTPTDDQLVARALERDPAIVAAEVAAKRAAEEEAAKKAAEEEAAREAAEAAVKRKAAARQAAPAKPEKAVDDLLLD